MCVQCWYQLGCPALRSPAIDRAAMLVGRLHEFSPVGGNLADVTCGWNVDTDALRWCGVILAGSGQWLDGQPPQHELEQRILDLMLPMTEAERGSVLALQQGLARIAGH